MKHKHYDCIVAWAEGKQIEVFSDSKGQWEDVLGVPYWVNNFLYRIKPEPKPDVVRQLYVDTHERIFESVRFNLRLTFDGETGKLKSAEVL